MDKLTCDDSDKQSAPSGSGQATSFRPRSDKFYWLREQSELRKKPSTSELIDWISALLRSGISQEKLESHIPFIGALLKKEQDVDALLKYDEKGGRFPARWADLGPRYNQ